MTVREHEPIAVGPDGVLWIEAHDAVPDRVNERRQCHRRAGVSRTCLLDRVHRERADRIDRKLIELLVSHRSLHWGHCAIRPASREATLPRRRKCRSAWLNSAARNVWTRSQATAGPTVRPPIQ